MASISAMLAKDDKLLPGLDPGAARLGQLPFELTGDAMDGPPADWVAELFAVGLEGTPCLWPSTLI